MIIEMSKKTNEIQVRDFQSTSHRVIGLDLLRIALALLIFMFHSWMHFGCRYSYMTDFVSVGAIAMTGFFLLSGYSMRIVYGEQNLIDKKNISRFYFRRIISIIPLYYIVALVYIVFMGKESLLENLLLFPIEALCLQSTFSSLFNVTHNGGTWFISCIMLAYLFYPFLQTIFKQISNRSKLLILLVLVFIDIWAAIIRIKFNTAWTYENPFYRGIEFTCGLIIADINISYNGKIMRFLRSWSTLIISIIILIVGISLVQNYMDISDYMLLNIIALPCFIIMLFPLGYLKMPNIENSRIVNYLSKISYAFFLSQYFAWITGKWFVDLIGYNQNWVRILFSLTLCIVISVIMYELIQRPITRLIKK